MCTSGQLPAAKSEPHLSRNEIFKRIGEERERHKPLRERRWVQANLALALPSYNFVSDIEAAAYAGTICS
ncbi:hypothetical protein DFH29DRAFT_890816 [Suillus ampliporus]|nr:hypothetical protein DFH29DRAFT_890816 [Suillus ampliporus]